MDNLGLAVLELSRAHWRPRRGVNIGPTTSSLPRMEVNVLVQAFLTSDLKGTDGAFWGWGREAGEQAELCTPS